MGKAADQPLGTVDYTSDGGVATIRMNRPDSENAFNDTILEGLIAAWNRYEASDDRCAVLAGVGRSFCAGADSFTPPSDVIGGLLAAIPWVGVKLSKPVIAAVQGTCLGSGYLLAQSCDMIIAAEDARFSYPETRYGITGGTATGIVSRVPHKVAMEFLLMGEEFTAQRAYEVGMVNRVVPVGDQERVAQEFAAKIADAAPMVVSLLKRYADASTMQSPVVSAIQIQRAVGEVVSSDDRAEGLAALREGRDPKFTGK